MAAWSNDDKKVEEMKDEWYFNKSYGDIY